MAIIRIAAPTAARSLIEWVAARNDNAPPAIFRVFPAMRTEILINLGDAINAGDDPDRLTAIPRGAVLGARDRVYWQGSGERIAWVLVALTPLGCSAILGKTTADLRGAVHDLADLIDDAAPLLTLAGGGALADRAAALFAWAARLPHNGDRMLRCADEVRADQSIDLAKLAAEAGVGQRQLRRRFAREFGIAPKRYLAIMRFNRQLALAHPNPWLRDGADDWAEHYDESHLAREFRAHAGESLAGYRAAKRASGDRLLFTGGANHRDIGDASRT